MQEEPRYYIMFKGPPGGPHPVSEVAVMLADGRIGPATKVCPEHDEEWTTAGEVVGQIHRAGIDSLPRSTPPPARRPPTVLAPPRVPEPPAMKKLRLGTLLAALVLFFLPWLELRCSGKVMAWQSGYHTIVSDGVTTDEFKSNAKKSKRDPDEAAADVKKKNEGESANAWLVAGAAALVILALITGAAAWTRLSGILALTAAGLLVVQMVTGFPVERNIDEATKHLTDGDSGASRAKQSEASDRAMNAFFAQLLPRVNYTPWLWAELGALAACFLLSRAAAGSRDAGR